MSGRRRAHLSPDTDEATVIGSGNLPCREMPEKSAVQQGQREAAIKGIMGALNATNFCKRVRERVSRRERASNERASQPGMKECAGQEGGATRN